MDQGLNRRRFLGAAIGTRAAAAGAGSLASPALGDDGGSVPRNRRGIQLYTMRRVMDNSQEDARRVLRWLGRAGYTEVEPYWRFEWTPASSGASSIAPGSACLPATTGWTSTRTAPTFAFKGNIASFNPSKNLVRNYT
jgi:hypothetical protein